MTQFIFSSIPFYQQLLDFFSVSNIQFLHFINTLFLLTLFNIDKLRLTALYIPFILLSILNNFRIYHRAIKVMLKLLDTRNITILTTFPLLYFIIYHSDKNFNLTITSLVFLFPFVCHAPRIIVAIYIILIVTWCNDGVYYSMKQNILRLFKIFVSILLLPLLYIFSLYLQTFCSFSDNSEKYMSNEFNQSLKNAPKITTHEYVIDRSTVRIKGSFGYLNVDSEEVEVESSYKDDEENEKIYTYKKFALLTTNTYNKSHEFNITKLHQITYDDFDYIPTDELKIKDGDTIKITFNNKCLTYDKKKDKDEDNNIKFFPAYFKHFDQNKSELEFIVEIVNKNEENFLRAKRTYFRLKTLSGYYLTQMKDGTFSVSLYGLKKPQTFIIESNNIKTTLLNRSKSQISTYRKLNKYEMVKELFYYNLNPNLNRLKKKYYKREYRKFFFKSIWISLLILCFNIYYLMKLYILNVYIDNSKYRMMHDVDYKYFLVYLFSMGTEYSDLLGLEVVTYLNHIEYTILIILICGQLKS